MYNDADVDLVTPKQKHLKLKKKDHHFTAASRQASESVSNLWINRTDMTAMERDLTKDLGKDMEDLWQTFSRASESPTKQ